MDELSGRSSDNETLQHLSELSRLLPVTTEADTTRVVFNLVTQMLNGEGSILWLLNNSKTQLFQANVFHTDSAHSKAFEQELGSSQLRLGQGLAGLAWAENSIKVLQMPAMFSQSANTTKMSDRPVCSVAFPLLAGNAVIGVMEVVNCSHDICAGGHHSLIALLSNLVGSCIFGAYAVEKMQESGNTLALTNSKLAVLQENLRELKSRLSQEHDESAKAARQHAQFLTRVSRDIRTPLSGITSIVELMLRDELPDDTLAHLAIISESASSILTILEELVEFSRQETEQFAPGAGNESTPGLQKSASTAAPPAPIKLDNIRVLVVNGLLGAAEFVEAYTLASGIRCETASRGQSALVAMKQAQITDSAFDVVFVERLLPDMDAFQFARVVQQELPRERTKLVLVSTFDSAARDDYALQAGFAAHIAKPVKQQQVIGTLNAIIRGEGQIGAVTQSLLEKDQITPAAARGQRMILVVEDNPVNQKVALLQLRELGFFSTVVDNGRQAVEVIKQAEFDAILMDCQMPEMDGFEATKLIRIWEKTTGRHVPIIAMTASALSSDREECLSAGMDDYLSKPVTYDKLESVLSKWVESKENREPAGVQHMQRPNRDTEPFGTQPGLEPVDVEGLKELLGVQETAEVLDLFIASTEELIGQIKEAYDRQDAKSLKEAAHQLKGAAASVGANNIASNCLELERYAKDDRWDAMSKVTDGLSANFQNARSYIRTKFS